MKTFQQLKSDVTWKNYVAVVGMLITIASVLVTGGRILEQIEATRTDMLALKSAQAEYARTITVMQVALEKQIGRDLVHEEQIGSLRRDVDVMIRRRGQ